MGDLGREAAAFAGFLHAARQSWWQMFPLGPPGVSNSPYQVLSAFAGNPLLIDLRAFVKDGFLAKSDIEGFPPGRSDRVDFDAAWDFKKRRLRKAFAAFESRKNRRRAEFERFLHAHRDWLDDYALFCALKGGYRGVSWDKWDPEHRKREPRAVRRAAAQLRSAVRYHQYLQFEFFRQWGILREACRERGIGLIGDVPIFVAHDSADVWANPGLFYLDAKGKPICVAGCPPDYFSRTGQRWGNPLYRWDALRRSGYDWWARRFKTMFGLFDAARLDHFIGFHNYWRIPAAHKNAIHGKWMPGPGAPFFETLFRRLGRLNFIAEDLGAVTPEVEALRDKLGLPGMRVLQFAFGGDPSNPFLPHNFPRNTVVFTGTHDNDTSVGWFRGLKPRERKNVLRYLGTSGRDIHWDLVRAAHSSVARTVIVPAQDVLGLGPESRMNLPGTPLGNWEWRLTKGALSPGVARRLADLTGTYGRA